MTFSGPLGIPGKVTVSKKVKGFPGYSPTGIIPDFPRLRGSV
jgi:hypothetical protein